MLFGIVACSYSSHWNFGNHGGLTLGEIAVDKHNSGSFDLGGLNIHVSLLISHTIYHWKAFSTCELLQIITIKCPFVTPITAHDCNLLATYRRLVTQTWQMLTRGFSISESHSLDFLGGHSSILNKVNDWHSDSFHGAHVIPVVKHIGNTNCVKCTNKLFTITVAYY